MNLDFENAPTLVLNFLPASQSIPEVAVFTKKCEVNEARPSRRSYRYYDQAKQMLMWASFKPQPKFGKEDQFPLGNYVGLMSSFLAESLLYTAIKERWSLFKDRKRFFPAALSVICEHHKEGMRVMTLSPEYIEAKKCHGLCLREDFRTKKGEPFNRAVLIRSGSLDANGRPNSKYHVEAWRRLQDFLSRWRSKQNGISLTHPACSERISFAHTLSEIAAPTFPKRFFCFGSNAEGSSQYHGVRQFGPFAKPPSQRRLLTYVGLEKDRPIARILYNILEKGCVQPDFDGLNKLFGTHFELNPEAKFVPLADFGEAGINSLVRHLKSVKNIGDTVVMVVIPRTDSEDSYSRLKAALLSEGIISQFCTRELISAATSLKWSAANIALGIFSKAGGSPWHVKTTGEKSVIIGLAQSVEGRKDNLGKWHAVRHLAYSILTDSSGEFRQLDQLADVVEDEGCGGGSYAAEIGKALRRLLRTEAVGTTLITVHCPFMLKRAVIDEVENSINDVSAEFASKCTFCVVKINQGMEHSWFGFAPEANSFIPPEGSVMMLAPREYLLWFEGIDSQRRLAKKRYGPPTHVRFIGRLPDQNIVAKVLLDLVDLSGANWRGFNARSEPVSIYYCKLVAKFLRSLHVHGIPVPPVKNLNPWFL